MSNKNQIKAIVFDVGNILLPLNWERVKSALQLDQVSFEKLLKEIQNWDLHHQYERGEVSSEVFLSGINNKLNTLHSHVVLATAWNSFVGDVFPEMTTLIRKLKTKVRVFTLSNINELHFDHVIARNPVFQELDHFFASHIMRARKPETKIFEILLNKISHFPDEVLFFDDVPENIETAKLLGLHAYLIKDSLLEVPPILEAWGLLP